MNDTEQLQAEIEQIRQERKTTDRENQEVRRLVRTEAMPLWERIRLRRQENGFGHDYEIALTRRM